MKSITNFLQINEFLGTAGQPEPDQFELIHQAGYELVINLLPHSLSEELPDEEELVGEVGLDYLQIPVIWKEPARQDLDLFFQALQQNRGRKIFVHCMMNYRVSVFVFLYRVLVEQVPVETARQAMLEVWEPDATWQNFIDACLLSS